MSGIDLKRTVSLPCCVYQDLTVIVHEDLWRICETTFRV